MKRIIFYHPQKIVDNPTSGSELRPKKMKEAFERNGYEVEPVVGNSKQRKYAIKKIKKALGRGIRYDFLYGESLNMPVPFTDSHHIPIRPFQDYAFFRTLNKNEIPIGFFYRDIYWRDKEANRGLVFYKYGIKKFFHWMEWFGIKKTVDYLFLPTKIMAKYLPHTWPSERLEALYPGCSTDAKTEKLNSVSENMDKKLNLFYVGGIKPPLYDLKPMIGLMSEVEGANLILCCRKKEWDDYSHIYDGLDFSDIEIVHADSNEIEKYYRKADIFLDIRKPEGYLKTTIPIKIFESIGYNVPLLLLEGTEYAKFVNDTDAGWVIETVEEAGNLLKKLKGNKNLVLEKTNKLEQVRNRNSWQERAKKASTILLKSGIEHYKGRVI